jgi:hypothetical protein
MVLLATSWWVPWFVFGLPILVGLFFMVDNWLSPTDDDDDNSKKED